MYNEPIVITEYGLVRILKDFALRTGMSDTFADVLAQTYLQTSPIAKSWTRFIHQNCATCAFQINTCSFMAPTEKDVKGTQTPRDIQMAVALMIENGQIEFCPAYKQQGPDND